MEYTSINNGESGLIIRNKINNMFSALIAGKQSINEVWKQIMQLFSDLGASNQKADNIYYELKEQVLNSFSYTDSVAEDLKSYINGIDGGVSAFAEDTSYNPDFPLEKSATILATEPGTYENILGMDGLPITISQEDALVIFYKDANSSYWRYKTILGIVIKEAINGGDAYAQYD